MRIPAIVVPGHRVASGTGEDSRYPEGTLRIQQPFFLNHGVDLSPYFIGTLNVDIAPHTFRIRTPLYFIEGVNWSPHIPPENFYFFTVRLHVEGQSYDGMIYMPDPETKHDHPQKGSILELLLPRIDGMNYGKAVELEVLPEQLDFF